MNKELYEKISALRRQIDIVDNTIFSSMLERRKLSEEIIRIKQENGLEIFDPDREQEIITKAIRKYSPLLDPDLIKQIIRIILKDSKSNHK